MAGSPAGWFQFRTVSSRVRVSVFRITAFRSVPWTGNMQLVLLKEAAVHDGPKFPGIFVRLGRVLTRNKKASNYLSFSCFWFYIYGTLQSNYDGIIQRKEA